MSNDNDLPVKTKRSFQEVMTPQNRVRILSRRISWSFFMSVLGGIRLIDGMVFLIAGPWAVIIGFSASMCCWFLLGVF